MSVRVAGNWLKAYLAYTAELETDEIFHIWCGLSVLASAIRRNCWVNQGHYLMYPNLYVTLVGPPGDGKSTAIRAGRRLLVRVEDIFFGPDSLTREEMIAILAKISEKDVNKSAAMTIHSNELASLIEPSGMHMISLLTELYDCDDTFKYSTKHQGKDVIQRPCVNILAGTTASWIADNLPTRTIGHGYLSRKIFVYADTARFLNPRPNEPNPALIAALVEDLKHISQIKGEYKFAQLPIPEGTPESEHRHYDAGLMYDYMYRKIYSVRPKDYRLTDFHARKGKAHLLKAAMLLAVAERDERIIYPVDVEVAYDLLTRLEAKMHKAFSGVGGYEHATDLERIYDALMNAGEVGIEREQLYSENYAVGNVDEVGRIIQMLEKMGKIRAVGRKNRIFYVSTAHAGNGKSANIAKED